MVGSAKQFSVFLSLLTIFVLIEGCHEAPVEEPEIKNRVVSWVMDGRLEVACTFSRLHSVSSFSLEKYQLTSGTLALPMLGQVHHSLEKPGQAVRVSIPESSIPPTAVELVCEIQFSLNEHRVAITAVFRKEAAGNWVAVADALTHEWL